MRAPDAGELAVDFDTLRAAVAGAGEIVGTYYGKSPKTWDKEGHGPVSEADLAANEHLRAHLLGARRGYGWLSEESADDPERLVRRAIWVVDPIDGTRAFVAGKPEFTICAALIVDGAPVLAAVLNPATRESFTARRGAGAWLNDVRLSLAPPPPLDAARILARKKAWKPEFWGENGPPGGARGYVSSIAYRLCLVAAGRWDGCIALNPLHEWDSAAAELILTEAGGLVTDPAGGPLGYNRATPALSGLVCAAPALHTEILQRIRPEPDQ